MIMNRFLCSRIGLVRIVHTSVNHTWEMFRSVTKSVEMNQGAQRLQYFIMQMTFVDFSVNAIIHTMNRKQQRGKGIIDL